MNSTLRTGQAIDEVEYLNDNQGDIVLLIGGRRLPRLKS